MTGVKIENNHHENGYTDNVGHIPIMENVLDSCVLGLKGDSPIPVTVYQGVSMWEEGNGGAFDKPVSEILDFIEETLKIGKKVEHPALYCFEFDYKTCRCEIKNVDSSCNGNLAMCQFFTVRTKNELCVLTSTVNHDGENKEVVESTFFLGEGFEKRGLIEKAMESYKTALSYHPDNEFLKNKLGTRKKPFWKFWG